MCLCCIHLELRLCVYACVVALCRGHPCVCVCAPCCLGLDSLTWPLVRAPQGLTNASGMVLSAGGSINDSAAFLGEGDQGVHSWEVRLVLEYCDQGSLRDALTKEVSLNG